MKISFFHNHLLKNIYHILACLFFTLTAIYLFRYPLFYSYRFIGNSDRLNHYLSFAKFHTDNLASGNFSAWSEHLFMGFDTLALPFSFFQPLFALPVLLNTSDVVVVFNYIAPIILLLTLLVNYAVMYGFCHDRLAAITGAFIFTLSTFSLLKLSQNDNTYLSVFSSPVLFYLVHSTHRNNIRLRILLITFWFWVCLYIAFLQEFSYIVFFLLCYGSYLWCKKNKAPLVALLISLGLATVLSIPRLQALFETIADSSRRGGFIDYLHPIYFLRFLDGNIFGSSMRQALEASKVANLSEGNLLFASTFASLLLLFITLRCRYKAVVSPDGQTIKAVRYGFFTSFILLVFLVIHYPPAYKFFAFLYANISFAHTRLSVAALLPIALVSSLFLTRNPQWQFNRLKAIIISIIVIGVIFLSLADFDFILSLLGQPSGRVIRLPGIEESPLFVSVILHFALLAIVFTVLIVACRPFKLIDSGTLKTILSLVIIGQALFSADQFMNGSHTRTYTIPFEKHDSVIAKPNEFVPPSPEQILQMHKILDNKRYRSIIVCPPEQLPIYCSNNIGLTWRLRLIDGYLSSLSKRYGSLPWLLTNSDIRTIRFNRLDPSNPLVGDVPWKLASLLNVRNAILLTPELFVNQNFDVLKNLKLVTNPSPYIYPRVYFAKTVKSANYTQVQNAIQEQFGRCDRFPTPQCGDVLEAKLPIDYVEGVVDSEFDDSGEITWQFEGDRAVINFPASTRKRFLIINETYSPRWQAYADAQPLAIYPTNLVMRGIVVPEQTTQVILRYRSVIDDTQKYLAVVLPIIVFSVVILHKRLQKLLQHILK